MSVLELLVAVAVLFAVLGVLGAVADLLDARDRRRREVSRLGRIDCSPRSTAPRFTRDDPSPSPRRRG